MQAYNPSVNDRSGEILGQSQVGAAQTRAESMQQMGQDIGSAITSLAGMYAQDRMQVAGGKAFKDFMGMAAPAMGIKADDLELFKKINDRDAFQLSQQFLPVAPSMISATGLGKHYNSMALANQNAANQAAARQPAPNQIPMGSGNPPPASNPPTDTNTPTTPVFGAGIQTRRVY
jgi:hypothetical protein